MTTHNGLIFALVFAGALCAESIPLSAVLIGAALGVTIYERR